MNRPLARLAFCVVASATVAGCGASNEPSAVVTPRLSKSWVSPAASSSTDLVYALTANSVVSIYSYPGGTQVGSLTGFASLTGICSDGSGNVWIIDTPSSQTSTLYEYAHAGSHPIATLNGPKSPYVCSVDPASGNLALGDLDSTVAVYTGARGSPTYYSTVGFMEDVRIITYDGSGDLYFRSEQDKTATGWLQQGGSSVMHFGVTRRGSYGWDGQHLAIRGLAKMPKTNALILFKVVGGGGSKVGQVRLNGCNGTFGTFSIRGSELAVPCLGNTGYTLSYYNYPSGGNPIAALSVHAFDVTISVGSLHSKPR